MSRTGRVLVVLAAWVLPVAWVTGALLAGPSDGTVVSSSAFDSTGRWGNTVTVIDVVGDRPLQPGDVVRSIDGRPVGDWVSGEASAQRAIGETVTYEILRPAPDLDRDLDVAVTLTRYPVEAVGQHAAALVGFGLVLLAGSLVFWRRPDGMPERAFLAAAALLPAWLTTSPLGPGVIDLAGSRGTWPPFVGGLLCALGLGAAAVAALTLARPDTAPRPRGLVLLTVAAFPLAGYAAWLLGPARGLSTEAARLQGQVTVVPPALVVALPTVVALLCWRSARSDDRATTLATRLALIGILGGLVARVLLGDLPQRLTGDPLLPWDVLVLLITPLVLGCLVVAVDGSRLEEVEPTVRRAVVQALAVGLVATSFVAVAAAVGQASDIGFRSLLAGGVLALLVLPLAVAMQRLLRRAVYGDREFPHRVVSELRSLDTSSAPEALTETLSLLARRLRLSYAAIDVRSPAGSEPLQVAIGESRGNPVNVDLVAGGIDLGRLRLEVAPQRDPFGPGDRRLLEDVGVQVGALVQAVLANRELQLSRQHLVTAREEERRRLRRDLHDGLGPALATLAMRLESVSDLIGRDPAGAAELADALSEQARAEILEVRRLVDGLRPPALDQLGLVSALRQRAEEHRVPGAPGGRMTWTVEADDDVEPLPAAVEVAAYRIALEAVTNALRHSGAERCTVTLRREDGTLLLQVRDTGRGLAADPGAGVGLTSMTERAEELGGTCTVSSSEGGTLVDVRLPISGEGGA